MFQKISSKRDPYFGRRVLQKGSPFWLGNQLLIKTGASIILANFATPIFYSMYVEILGVNRGNWQAQGQRVQTFIYGFVPNEWLSVIQPWHFSKYLNILPSAWTAVFVVALTITVFYTLKSWRNAKNDQANEYGGAEFTEPAQVKKQYQGVPDRGGTFPGYGGVPVSHQYQLNSQGLSLYLATVTPKWLPKLPYHAIPADVDTPKSVPGKYYLDHKAVNTLIVADTRAGKGQTMVLPAIDLIARGQADQSLVIGDMKGELATLMSDELKRLNYDVQIANFQNLSYSMPIQLLSQAIYYAKKENYARARAKVSQLSNTIFPENENDKNRFFTAGARSTFSGLCLATMWLMKRENDWDKVTVGNAAEMLQKLGTQLETVDMNGERMIRKPGPMDKTKQMNKLDLLISCLEKVQQQNNAEGKPTDELLQMAISAFNQSNTGGKETKGNIYASMFADVELFTSDISVRKLTTLNNFRYSSLGFPRLMEIQLPKYMSNRKVAIQFEAQGNFYSEVVIADEQGLVQFAIEPKLDDYTTFELTFDITGNFNNLPENVSIADKKITIEAKKVFEYSHLKKKLDPYSGLPVIKGYKVIELNTDLPNSDEIEVTFDYSEKKTAVFVILPPSAPQYTKLAMFFVEQLYQENYDMADRNKKKNINRVHFFMDEFGNFPKWPGMATKLSAAIGYNFAFSMVLQNLEQLTETYGAETAATIRANSSNFAYIKTSSQKTAEEISKELGDRTITYSTPGDDTSSGDSRNRSIKEQPLLSANQLTKFRPSQMLFFRSAQNTDKKGNLVDTNPIYNYGWTSMPFAYNLLKNYTNDTPELSRIEVDSPQRYIDLDDYKINFEGLLDELYLETHPTYAEFMQAK